MDFFTTSPKPPRTRPHGQQYYTARSFGRWIYLPCRMDWTAGAARRGGGYKESCAAGGQRGEETDGEGFEVEGSRRGEYVEGSMDGQRDGSADEGGPTVVYAQREEGAGESMDAQRDECAIEDDLMPEGSGREEGIEESMDAQRDERASEDELKVQYPETEKVIQESMKGHYDKHANEGTFKVEHSEIEKYIAESIQGQHNQGGFKVEHSEQEEHVKVSMVTQKEERNIEGGIKVECFEQAEHIETAVEAQQDTPSHENRGLKAEAFEHDKPIERTHGGGIMEQEEYIEVFIDTQQETTADESYLTTDLMEQEEDVEASIENQQERTTTKNDISVESSEREPMKPLDAQEPAVGFDTMELDEKHLGAMSDVPPEAEDLGFMVRIEFEFVAACERDVLGEISEEEWDEEWELDPAKERATMVGGQHKAREDSQGWFWEDQDVRRLISNQLRKGGLDVVCATHRTSNEELDYSRWIVALNDSINSKQGMHPEMQLPDMDWVTTGVVVTTAALQLDTVGQWLSNIDIALRTVTQDPRLNVWTNESCDLHVRVGKANREPFELLTLQNLIVFWGLYDGPLTALHGRAKESMASIEEEEDRKVTGHKRKREGPQKATRAKNLVNETKANLLDLKDDDAWIQAVYACGNETELSALMGMSKHRALNIINLAKHEAKHSGSHNATLEFREYPGTLSLADVKFWTLFTTGMVRWVNAVAEQKMTVNASGQLALDDLFYLIDLPKEGRKHLRKRSRRLPMRIRKKEVHVIHD